MKCLQKIDQHTKQIHQFGSPVSEKKIVFGSLFNNVSLVKKKKMKSRRTQTASTILIKRIGKPSPPKIEG